MAIGHKAAALGNDETKSLQDAANLIAQFVEIPMSCLRVPVSVRVSMASKDFTRTSWSKFETIHFNVIGVYRAYYKKYIDIIAYGINMSQ